MMIMMFLDDNDDQSIVNNDDHQDIIDNNDDQDVIDNYDNNDGIYAMTMGIYSSNKSFPPFYLPS